MSKAKPIWESTADLTGDRYRLSEKPTMKAGWQVLGDRVVEWRAQLEQEAEQKAERRLVVYAARQCFGETVTKAVDARLAEGAGNGAGEDILVLMLRGTSAEDVLHRLNQV